VTSSFVSYRQFRLRALLAVITAVCLLGSLWQWPEARVFVYAGAGFVTLSSLHLAAMITLFFLLDRFLIPLVVRPPVRAPLEAPTRAD
jgi:hypothetical protein